MENTIYQRDLLNQAVIDMQTLCFSQFEKAMEALLKNDADLAEEVIHKEIRVNALDLKIEKDCEHYIALFTPVATDLRHAMAMLKINYELERIADHAYGISKYIVDDEELFPANLLKVISYKTIVDTITEMFELIADAYENSNVKSARKIFKKDKVLDEINSKSFKILEAEIKNNVEVTGKALILLSVIKKCERVGDLLKNIAEEIIFYIDAEVVKHSKRKGN